MSGSVAKKSRTMMSARTLWSMESVVSVERDRNRSNCSDVKLISTGKRALMRRNKGGVFFVGAVVFLEMLIHLWYHDLQAVSFGAAFVDNNNRASFLAHIYMSLVWHPTMEHNKINWLARQLAANVCKVPITVLLHNSTNKQILQAT